MGLNESIVEVAALEWFGEMGYAVGRGPQFAPGEPAAERDSFGDVVLVDRLRDALQRINPTIPCDAREDALRKVLRWATPSLVGTNRLFHAMLRDGVPVEYQRTDGRIAPLRYTLLPELLSGELSVADAATTTARAAGATARTAARAST